MVVQEQKLLFWEGKWLSRVIAKTDQIVKKATDIVI